MFSWIEIKANKNVLNKDVVIVENRVNIILFKRPKVFAETKVNITIVENLYVINNLTVINFHNIRVVHDNHFNIKYYVIDHEMAIEINTVNKIVNRVYFLNRNIYHNFFRKEKVVKCLKTNLILNFNIYKD